MSKKEMNELLNAVQVAAAIGASVNHVYVLVRRGALASPVKIGRCSRWRRADVDRMLRAMEGSA